MVCFIPDLEILFHLQVPERKKKKPHQRCGCPACSAAGRCCLKHFHFCWNVYHTRLRKYPTIPTFEAIKQLHRPINVWKKIWKTANYKRGMVTRCVPKIPGCNLPSGQWENERTSVFFSLAKSIPWRLVIIVVANKSPSQRFAERWRRRQNTSLSIISELVIFTKFSVFGVKRYRGHPQDEQNQVNLFRLNIAGFLFTLVINDKGDKTFVFGRNSFQLWILHRCADEHRLKREDMFSVRRLKLLSLVGIAFVFFICYKVGQRLG